MRRFRDSRQHPRIPLDVEVMVRSASGQWRARARQIGAGGMSLAVEGAELGISQPIHLLFTLPGAGLVQIAAVVWWRQGALMGVRFDYSGPERARVEDWVNRNLASAAYFAKPI